MNAPDCTAACDLINGTCFALTRDGACRWSGIITQNASCFPISIVSVDVIASPIISGGTRIVLLWVQASGRFATYIKDVSASTINCSQCFAHNLFPTGSALTSGCNQQFSMVEVSFNRLNGCCENCHSSLQVDVFIDSEDGSSDLSDVEPAPGAPACDTACDGVIGSYVLLDTGEGHLHSPNCTKRFTVDYCEYLYEFPTEIVCSNLRINEIAVRIGIANCLLDIIGEIRDHGDTVACFSQQIDHQLVCNGVINVTLPFVQAVGGQQMCHWNHPDHPVKMRIRS